MKVERASLNLWAFLGRDHAYTVASTMGFEKNGNELSIGVTEVE